MVFLDVHTGSVWLQEFHENLIRRGLFRKRSVSLEDGVQGLAMDDFILPRSLPTSPTSPTAAAGMEIRVASGGFFTTPYNAAVWMVFNMKCLGFFIKISYWDSCSVEVINEDMILIVNRNWIFCLGGSHFNNAKNNLFVVSYWRIEFYFLGEFLNISYLCFVLHSDMWRWRNFMYAPNDVTPHSMFQHQEELYKVPKTTRRRHVHYGK